MGLVIFGAFGLYLVVAVAVVVMAARQARRKGKNPWAWGTAAGLTIYLPVFWDHIPTVLTHKYYCENEAGLLIYKTAEQWTKENPAVAESLVPQKFPLSTRTGNTRNYVDSDILNDRLKLVIKKNGPFPLHRWRHEQSLVDIKTDAVLGTNIDFSTGYGYLAVASGDDWQVLKFWLANPHCGDGARRESQFREFRNSFPGVYK